MKRKPLDPDRELSYGMDEKHVKKSEAQIQAEGVKWYNNDHTKSVPNAKGCLISVHNNADNGARGSIALSLGRQEGASDLLYFGLNGRLLCIEMKTPEGVQSEVQRQWESSVWARGFDYILCRSKHQLEFIVLWHDQGKDAYEIEMGWIKYCKDYGIDKLTGEPK